MNRIVAIVLLLVLSLSGCTCSTEFGPCVGMGDEEKSPDLVYKMSGWNLALGIIFVETIVVPIVVGVDFFYCPVGKKSHPEPPADFNPSR